MSSLYRCRARVGYRPYGSEQLIVFDERQVQELSVKLKWQPNLAFANANASTPATAATNALSQSTCSVTISDPYLTGLAWPALFDAAQLYTQANVAAANNILLPPCEEGQDPYVDKCFKYVDTAVEGEDSSGLGIKNFPFLLVSLWYDVKGTSFGTDFYFRVSGFSVSHGTKYPSVTIRGVEARSVIFNQSLVNMTLDEGVEIEQALKKLAESLGYSVSFCANSNSEPERKRILPRTVRYTGITTGEAIKKVLDSVNGNSLSLPIREYANKISMCTRGEVDQGCSVFYLGKGLYEGYEISGQPELTALALNAGMASRINNKDPYVSEAFKASTYFIGDVAPQKRKKAMEKVKKVNFPGLFEKVPKNVKGAPTATGYVWRDQQSASANTKGIQVINEEATKISKDGLNLFGVAPNGTTSISFLSGDVQEASQADGRILIKTNFSLHICEKEGSKKCFYRPILQESTGLTTVKVKAKDKVEINQEIGTSTSEKKEFVRFYIVGHSGQVTTLNPKIVWDWAFPETEIPPAPSPSVTSNAPTTSPVGAVVPAAPKANLKDWSANNTQKPNKVLITPGHGDITTGQTGAAGEKALVREVALWMQRNVSKYGLQGYVEFNIPSSTTNISDVNNPNALWTQGKKVVDAGGKAIDLHMDQASGSSGVIPPCGRYANNIGVLDDTLASSYGAFGKNHSGCLGAGDRGVTIVELGRMDSATLTASRSSDPATREKLYAQLGDPVMRAIAAEKARTGTTAAGAASSASASAASSINVGRVGSTGESSGPHLHAELGPFTQPGGRGQPITAADVDPYVLIAGKPASAWGVYSPYGPRTGGMHYGIDFSGPGPGGENINGQPVSVTGGATIVETKENWRGYGNAVIIKRPDGKEMILAHLQDKSIPPNIAGLSTSSGGGKNNPTIQGSPTTSGLMVETSFKGVPRALRIIPGRTILSFITDYDAWVEEGRPASRDPGVWIANRFKNWFVSECEYRWREGDLRVQIEGVTAWGTIKTTVPTFQNYLKSMRKSGDAKISSNYYDYIRSIGELNWITESGKDSTEERCPEAQALSTFLSQGSDSTSPSDTSTSFPQANCKTGDGTKDSIINALYSAGLNTPNAFAGALGNLQEESNFNPNVHNTSIQGVTCKTDSGVPEKCYGLAQWGGSRKIRAIQKCGQTSTLQCQLEFMVQDIKQRGGGTVQAMNSATSASAAAEIWRRQYEVASGGIAKRQQFAEQIVKQIKCDKPS